MSVYYDYNLNSLIKTMICGIINIGTIPILDHYKLFYLFCKFPNLYNH